VWQTIERGLSVGNHRPLRADAGTRWARVLVDGRYRIEAATYDQTAADGEVILNWSQAQAVTRAWAAKHTPAGPLTVKQACHDYIANCAPRKAIGPPRMP
jgi:phage-related baseplate assembly protein